MIAFEMVDRGIPRHGYELVNADGEKIGEVTSGTMSPMRKIGIGMGDVYKRQLYYCMVVVCRASDPRTPRCNPYFAITLA